jgi:hypothetical protein
MTIRSDLVIGCFPDPLQRGGEPLGHATRITFVRHGVLPLDRMDHFDQEPLHGTIALGGEGDHAAQHLERRQCTQPTLCGLAAYSPLFSGICARAAFMRCPSTVQQTALLLRGNIVGEEAMWMAEVVRQLANTEIHDVVRTGGAI